MKYHFVVKKAAAENHGRLLETPPLVDNKACVWLSHAMPCRFKPGSYQISPGLDSGFNPESELSVLLGQLVLEGLAHLCTICSFRQPAQKQSPGTRAEKTDSKTGPAATHPQGRKESPHRSKGSLHRLFNT